MAEKVKELCITTIDNPWSPIKNFDEWYAYDISKGYNTCSKLARLASYNEDLSEQENIKEINRAIKTLIEFNDTGLYTSVEK